MRWEEERAGGRCRGRAGPHGHLAVARLLTGAAALLGMPAFPSRHLSLIRIPLYSPLLLLRTLPFGKERPGSSEKWQGNFIYILLTCPSVTP